MAATLERDALMPTGLDADGQVTWWVLGAIARINADDRWSTITAAELDAFDDDDWDGLAADTPQIDGPLTADQRARIGEQLADLEATASDDGPWWER